MLIPVASRAIQGDPPPLEAVPLDVLGKQLLELLNTRLLLGLHVAPEALQVCPTVGVGDVLVVSPHGVEPPAQFVNQVVIVIRASARLSDVFVFFLGCHGHGTVPFQ
jgi:hypothetical protein